MSLITRLFSSKKGDGPDEEDDEEQEDDFEVKYQAERTHDFDDQGIISFLMQESQAQTGGVYIPSAFVGCT